MTRANPEDPRRGSLRHARVACLRRASTRRPGQVFRRSPKRSARNPLDGSTRQRKRWTVTRSGLDGGRQVADQYNSTGRPVLGRRRVLDGTLRERTAMPCQCCDGAIAHSSSAVTISGPAADDAVPAGTDRIRTIPSGSTARAVLELTSCDACKGDWHWCIAGHIRNVGPDPLEDLEVVVTWFSRSGAYVTSHAAAVANPRLMPRATSTFRAIALAGPLMRQYSVTFRGRGHGSIAHTESPR